MNASRYSTDSPGVALLTAVFTPFDDDGHLALATVEKQVDALVAWG